jgi:hypothetical protein
MDGCNRTVQYSCVQHLMVPWFSTPKVRPSLGVLLSNSHAADAAAVQEGLALLGMCMHDGCRRVVPDESSSPCRFAVQWVGTQSQ